MPFKKGKSGNPSGKPKGAVNKTTQPLRESITAFLENNWNKVQLEFDKLDAKEKLQFFEKLLQYSVPKMQAISHDMDIDLPGASFKLPDGTIIDI